ncbi:hypothetical protein IAR55_003472 [Kwoniella newhampshirensis]|uniref:18S rRNA biogenesis protein RCL1 n=1 Tax=Kwoniella newhampshirensis TaxID=1651941 RepID=A0AAW0Z1C8_9TREE
MQAGPSRDILRFTGHRHLRQRVLLSILSGKSIRVDAIRSDDVHVGLRDYEINLLRLAEKVDMIRTVTLPHLHLFGVTEGLELQIKKRGSAPLGGGQAIFKCPVVRHLKTLQFVEKGKIKKIRGVASPGYGLTLVAQSTTSALHSSECLSTSGNITTPEDIALQSARLLLQELSTGGCVDSKHQWLVALLMALGKEDVGKCLLDMLVFFGTKFKIAEQASGEVLLSCIGIGYSNVNKSMA